MIQKKSKTRNTRNSQRLVNLEQQEKFYKNLGLPAMTTKKESKVDEEIVEMEEGSGNEEGEDSSKENSPKPSEEEPPPKKVPAKKSKAKRAHSISSDSESEKEKNVPKKKKKKKNSLAGRNSSQLDSSSSSFAVNADVHRAADGSTGGFQRNTSPLVLPQNLMTSPSDSNTLTAHMAAYTRFLMENNLLFGQGQRNTTQGQSFSAPDNMQFSQNQGVNQSGSLNQGFNTLSSGNLNQGLLQQNNNNQPQQRGIMDDSSIDGLSNADPLDLPAAGENLRNIAFMPEVLQPEAPEGPRLSSNLNEEVLLSQYCEAEKEVDQEDDTAVGPEVTEKIMLMVKNFLGRSRKAAKVEELALEFLRPKNMPFLKSPMIEEEIYLDLAGQARHFDKNCRGLQGYLNAAMTANMRCMEILISLEKLHPKITQAGVMAKKALQLMAFTNRDINDRRKDALKVAVNPDYLPILKHAKPPSEDWLLGGSLTDAIKQCDESKRLTEKIMKSRKNNIPGQQDTQQHNVSGHFPQQSGKQKFKNRGNRKDFKNPAYQNNGPRQNWIPPNQGYQAQQGQRYGWQQSNQVQDIQFQQPYQQFLNQAYPNQQNLSYYPQYTQQQNQQQQQQLGFYQAQQPKTFYQTPQQYNQKKKN